VYKVVEGEHVEGRPVYKMDGADRWIIYWGETGAWHLKTSTDLKGTDSALMYSLGTQQETLVEDMTDGWAVYDPITTSYSIQEGVRVERYPKEGARAMSQRGDVELRKAQRCVWRERD
jgi:hypothetical protein